MLQLEGVELEEQSKSATEKARATGEIKKQVVPPDLLEEVFDLNMQLEELRQQKKAHEDDPALIEEVGRQKLELEEKSDALQNELQGHWNQWDQVESGGSERRAPPGSRPDGRSAKPAELHQESSEDGRGSIGRLSHGSA